MANFKQYKLGMEFFSVEADVTKTLQVMDVVLTSTSAVLSSLNAARNYWKTDFKWCQNS